MAQVFPRAANTVAKASIVGAGLLAATALGISWLVMNTSYVTEVDVVKPQPVPFSHEHHVRGLGIDCRYCHTSVEESAFAGMPPSYTCMSCHSQIWNQAPMLAPVRESLALDKPLVWNRINDVPDYAYFDHSIHVNKGVGCAECHGQVDRMPLMWKEEPMNMGWCLECHRAPEERLRPKEEIFNLHWTYTEEMREEHGPRKEFGLALAKEYEVPAGLGHYTPLTNCAVCHR
jgi:hypothetical protein